LDIKGDANWGPLKEEKNNKRAGKKRYNIGKLESSVRSERNSRFEGKEVNKDARTDLNWRTGFEESSLTSFFKGKKKDIKGKRNNEEVGRVVRGRGPRLGGGAQR